MGVCFIKTASYSGSMRTEIFTLCDAAAISSERKLIVHGAFDNIYAAEAPFSYPACAIAIRLRCDITDEGKHTLTLKIVNSDGKDLLNPLQGGLEIQAPPADLRTFCVDHIVNLRGLAIPAYDEYEISLLVDGQILGTIPFTVNKPAKKQG